MLSPDVLDMLLGLPVGDPVPVSALTARERGGLRTAPRWAVQVVNGQVRRHTVPPVAVDLALVAARSWRSGLDQDLNLGPLGYELALGCSYGCCRSMHLALESLYHKDLRATACHLVRSAITQS
jgi:hypothetical protein